MKTYTEAEQRTSGKAVANNSRDIKPVPLKTPALQTQVTIGKPNDKYEQEADKVADQVMSMPESAIQSQPAEEEEEEMLQTSIQMQEEGEEEMLQSKPMFQFQPVGEEEEELMPKLQMQPTEEEEEELQAKLQRQEEEEEILMQTQSEMAASRSKSMEWVQKNLNSGKSTGNPLPGNTRQFMKNRFGSDFTDVRIHTDSTAVQMNRSLRAQAFASGKHIYFNSGKYKPESTTGRHLLAHELTHVVQQGHAKVRRKNFIQRQKAEPQWKKNEKSFKAVLLSLDPKKPKSNSERFKESIEKTLGTLGKKKMQTALFNKLKLNSKGKLLLSVVGIGGYSLYSLGKGKIPALKYDFKVKNNTWLTVSTEGDFKKPKVMIGLKLKF